MQLLFDDHTRDTVRRELRRGGDPIALQPQVFDVLVRLMQNRERGGAGMSSSGSG